jgi:peptidyl-dipeptidase A
MLAIGACKPWLDALDAFNSSREMSGEPMLGYFRLLTAPRQQQNWGEQCGW